MKRVFNMNRRIVLTALLSLAVISGVGQAFRAGSNSRKHPLVLKVTEINNNNSDEVSRMSVSLLGVPHTSARIDSAQIHRGDGDIMRASDIDGVDFQRYFQWEDDGIINVEVDFPLNKNYGSADTLIVYTVYGPYRTNITID
ncbi:MAG: hypothetical protein HDS75_05775 [Bacteroidales bacterium]|nr:hypothetical protein [Bacteroidales bacterium]